MNPKEKTVFVALSGGVDSSVAALRLKKQGFHVVGVFIKVWQPDFLTCNWEEERLDAMRVAAHLDIPFQTFDAEAAYKKEVVDYMVREYKEGRTPNPDVMCNQHVKFGAFLLYAQNEGADYIATGHYARRKETDGVFHLLRAVDKTKDQSYFLFRLTQEELSKSLFPVGDTTKENLRDEATAHGIPTAKKKDSQGVCFLGQLDMADFLSHYLDIKEGPIVSVSGAIVGKHKGAYFYTIGQRHGFTTFDQHTTSKPYYVVKKDIGANTLTVQHEKPSITARALVLTDISFTHHRPSVGSTLDAVLRYREQPHKIVVRMIGEDSLTVDVDTKLFAPTPGQSCVLYSGEECTGGGIIEHITE